MKTKKQFSGRSGDCSPEQLAALEKFKNEADTLGYLFDKFDDPYLLRFLRARNFEVHKALDMWKNFIQWRNSKNVDQVMDLDFPEINEAKKYYPQGFFRTDKEGRPMYFERCGDLKIDNFMKIMTQERMEAYSIQKYERLINVILPGCSEAAGKRIEQTCFIVDLKNFKSSKMTSKTWDLVKLMSRIGTDYYPETLGVMFIVNAPMIFYGIWNVAKFFLDEETRQKIHILGKKYYKEIVKYVNEENLPDFLGGKATAEDYGENLTIEQGPWVHHPIKTPSLSQIDKNEYQEEDSIDKEEESPHKSLQSGKGASLEVVDFRFKEELELENIPSEECPIQVIREFKSQASLLSIH